MNRETVFVDLKDGAGAQKMMMNMASSQPGIDTAATLDFIKSAKLASRQKILKNRNANAGWTGNIAS